MCKITALDPRRFRAEVSLLLNSTVNDHSVARVEHLCRPDVKLGSRENPDERRLCVAHRLLHDYDNVGDRFGENIAAARSMARVRATL